MRSRAVFTNAIYAIGVNLTEYTEAKWLIYQYIDH